MDELQRQSKGWIVSQWEPGVRVHTRHKGGPDYGIFSILVLFLGGTAGVAIIWFPGPNAPPLADAICWAVTLFLIAAVMDVVVFVSYYSRPKTPRGVVIDWASSSVFVHWPGRRQEFSLEDIIAINMRSSTIVESRDVGPPLSSAGSCSMWVDFEVTRDAITLKLRERDVLLVQTTHEQTDTSWCGLPFERMPADIAARAGQELAEVLQIPFTEKRVGKQRK